MIALTNNLTHRAPRAVITGPNAQCSLWVKSRHFAVQKGMSALPPKATAIALGRTYNDWQNEHGLYLGDVPEIPEHLVDGHLTSNERE
jgi:hypothetical protein